MTRVINASSLTLREVHDRFQLRRQFEPNIGDFLQLQLLSTSQRDRLAEIRQAWERYYINGRVSEGQVNFLALSPLLWASGYVLDADLRISVEENIEEIAIDEGDTVIRGRIDAVVVREMVGDRLPFCVLAIESKNSMASTAIGLPQLLTYVAPFLQRQDMVWGLVTNGTEYQFVRVEPGVYRQFRSFSLLAPDEAEAILAVAIAIRQNSVRFS